jgi:uncharacterized protein
LLKIGEKSAPPVSSTTDNMMFVLLLVLTVCLHCAWGLLRSSRILLNSHRVGVTSIKCTKNENVLRKIDDWACVKDCGACCKLGPIESRPELSDYLSPEEHTTYVGMIGADDWCIHFDKTSRLCTNYDNRPTFCTVDPKKFKVMYDVDEEDFTDFCKFCCKENITDTYGELSTEMERFEEVIMRLEDEADAAFEDTDLE